MATHNRKIIMFCPIELALGTDKKTAMRQAKRVYLDTGRDTESRWNALEYLAMNLTGGDTHHNPRKIERGEFVDAENMGYTIWCSDRLDSLVRNH